LSKKNSTLVRHIPAARPVGVIVVMLRAGSPSASTTDPLYTGELSATGLVREPLM